MMPHSFRSTGLKPRPTASLTATPRSLAVMLGLAVSVLFLSQRVSAAPAANPALLQENFPFQGACISADFPKGNTAMKGLAIRVGNGASMLFDTELLRMAAGWTGQYITTRGVSFDGGHGGHPKINGEQKFGTRPLPGWLGARDEFKDPRSEPFGPLPADWSRYDGLYVNGMDVVLAYTVRGAKILEQPSSIVADGQTGFVRTFKTGKLKDALTLLVCEHESAPAQVNKEGTRASLKPGSDRLTQVGVAGLPKGAVLDIINDRIVLRLPKGAPAATFKVVIWNGAAADAGKFDALLVGTPKLADFQKGGPARWPEVVETQGVVGASKTPDGAYVLDSLTAPQNNPWKRRVRFGGLDFFPDGKRAALSTWDGDIWIVSGIDEKLEHLQWRRFASGMYETLGLKIVKGVIHTSGRDQITRYYDLNKDGEADYYENFCNLQTSSEGFHEFLFDLQTDAKGNFYFAKAGPVKPGGSGFETISASAGTLMKVSPDGKKLEVYASGFRAPNGIGVSPTGQVTTGDNEGTWVPTCPINWVKPGGFYGVEQLAHKNPVPAFNPPLCWLSKNGWDNSGGGQVWVTSKQWGPFYGQLFHCSYGECALYLVMKQDVNGLMQGGAVRLPLKFTSSAMRPKFNPKDGQLYVAGLQGWQTKAPKLAGLDRVRYTGKGVYSVRDLKVDKQGVHLTFTQPLDVAAAGDAQNYSVTRWNYERTERYGSSEFSVTTPGKKGRDTVEITGVKVSPDGKTVTLQIADLKPVMQQQIKFSLKAKDGTELNQEIQHTIHVVPDNALAAK
jgi:hypothetical protein